MEPLPTANSQVVSVMADGTRTCVSYGAATDPWVDGAPSGSMTLDDQLAAARMAIVGEWIGTATAPSGFIPQTWLDRFEFYPDGTYTAPGNDDGMVTPPLYYGDAEHCSPASWSLSGATTTGLTGSIDVLFSYDTGCALPSWGGILSNLRWDATGTRMRFSFSRSDGYGPIDLDLRLACLTL
jgi:hypothetical protein